MNTFDKQPAETYTIAIEFLDKLPDGATLSSGTIAGFDLALATTDNTILGSTTATISGTQAKVVVKLGTNGKDYKITFSVTLSDSSILEEDIIMRVRSI